MWDGRGGSEKRSASRRFLMAQRFEQGSSSSSMGGGGIYVNANLSESVEQKTQDGRMGTEKCRRFRSVTDDSDEQFPKSQFCRKDGLGKRFRIKGRENRNEYLGERRSDEKVLMNQVCRYSGLKSRVLDEIGNDTSYRRRRQKLGKSLKN